MQRLLPSLQLACQRDVWLPNEHEAMTLYGLDLLPDAPAALADGVLVGFLSFPTGPFQGSLLYDMQCLTTD